MGDEKNPEKDFEKEKKKKIENLTSIHTKQIILKLTIFLYCVIAIT